MTKKLLLLLLLVASYASAQTVAYSFQSNNVINGNGTFCGPTAVYCNSGASGSQFYQASWTKTGTVTACSVTVDSSVDNVTWTSGGIFTSQNCSVNGNTSVTNTPANYLRITVSSFSGSGYVQILVTGYITNPAGGGSGSSPAGDYVSSVYATPGGTGAIYIASVGSGANRCQYQPLRLWYPITVKRVAINVGASPGDSFGVAVYAPDGQTRYLTTGAVVTTGTGYNFGVISPAVTLQAGYYLSILCYSGTTTTYTVHTGQTGWTGGVGTGMVNGATSRQGSTAVNSAPGGVPPATFIPSGANTGSANIFLSND